MCKFKKNFLCTGIIGCCSNVIFNHLSNVILGFIPRIYAKNSPLLDTRVKPEYDGKGGSDISTPEDDYKVMQCGRSMIEMLGVLAIIGVLSVGGITGYSKAMEKFKINKTIQQISEIAANIQTLYIQQKDFNGLTNETAIQMGVIPDDLDTVTYNGNILNVYGYGSYVESDYRRPNYFYIGFYLATKEACIALATADWGNISNGVVAVGINNYSVVVDYLNYYDDNCTYDEKDNGYLACSKFLPIPPAIATQYCGKGDRETNAFIIFFKK